MDIKNEIPNDIALLVKANPSIKMIAFNGQKAEKLYQKYFDKFENIHYLTLLSTSPANATFSYKDKLADWARIVSTK